MTKETRGGWQCQTQNGSRGQALPAQLFHHSLSAQPTCKSSSGSTTIQSILSTDEAWRGQRTPAASIFPTWVGVWGLSISEPEHLLKIKWWKCYWVHKGLFFKKKIKRVKNLYLSCSEVFLLKICFQWCDNKWLCCSLKSGQPLCKGGKNCFIKMHEERNDGL